MAPPGHRRPFAALLPFPAPARDRAPDRNPEAPEGVPTAPDSSMGFAPIRELLPRVGITTRTLKKIEAIQLVREQRELHNQEVSYGARPFVLCGLPLRRPSRNQL